MVLADGSRRVKRENSGTERIALLSGVRARKVRGKVRPGACGNVGAASSMVRASREWERKWVWSSV